MYSKQEASLLSQQFWTTFGKYMVPVLSAEGEKINWVNYKTGIKFIRFNVQSFNNTVFIALELFNPDIAVQQQQFSQLTTFKKQFEATCGYDWHWEKTVSDKDGKTVSHVIATLKNANILNRAEWPAIISFLKPQLISLDEFWSNYKFAFE